MQKHTKKYFTTQELQRGFGQVSDPNCLSNTLLLICFRQSLTELGCGKTVGLRKNRKMLVRSVRSSFLELFVTSIQDPRLAQLRPRD